MAMTKFRHFRTREGSVQKKLVMVMTNGPRLQNGLAVLRETHKVNDGKGD
jgi:hypothetical protein